MIRKKADIVGLLFLGDGKTISITPLLNILVYGKWNHVAVLEFVRCERHLAYGRKNMAYLYVKYFLSTKK